MLGNIISAITPSHVGITLPFILQSMKGVRYAQCLFPVPADYLNTIIEFNSIISTKSDWNIADFLFLFLSLESAILLKRVLFFFLYSLIWFSRSKNNECQPNCFFLISYLQRPKTIKKITGYKVNCKTLSLTVIAHPLLCCAQVSFLFTTFFHQASSTAPEHSLFLWLMPPPLLMGMHNFL